MENFSIRNHPLFPPLLIGVASLLGICMILASTLLPKPSLDVIPTGTPTPFKYLFLASETAVPSLEPETNTSSRSLSTPKVLLVSGDTASSGQHIASTSGDPLTPSLTTAVAIEPTVTVAFSERCLSPTAEYLDPVRQEIESFDPDHELSTAWIVKSTDQEGLWFIGARIRGSDIDTGVISPGVWALLFYSEGYSDVYSINSVAMEFTSAAWGEGSEPPITMEDDGAQIVRDCAFTE